MAGFFHRIIRGVVGFGTRRILREALGSAIVTVVVTASFTGFSRRSEAPMPALAALATEVATPIDPARNTAQSAGASSADFARIWFDPTLVPPSALGFRHIALLATPAAKTGRRRTTAARPLLVTARSVPPAHPVDRQIVSRARFTSVTLAEAGPAPAPEDRGFRVFGVAPGDLIPSPSGIVRGAKSVGTTIASLTNWF